MDDPYMKLSVLERILDGKEKPSNLELALLRNVTKNFSDDRIIGKGGCGVVYKGILRNGSIAVKRLLQTHTIDDKMFRREVNSMMVVKHENIVRCLGYCSDTQEQAMEVEGKFFMAEIRERLLCFEYINNGSLDKHLSDELRGLEWHTRYQILKGICEGLHHLHKEKRICHMDLKPANILLGDHMVPKITDFGISRLDAKSQTTSKQCFMSLGYCAPEYIDYGKMSAKSDIYSLGVIIVELVTGSKENPNIEKVLQRWRHRWNKSSEHTPLLWYKQVAKCLDLALWCKKRNPFGRPHIWDIIRELNDIDSWDGQIRYATVSTLDKIMSCLVDMLGIEPLEMHFPFALNSPIPFSIELTNDTDDYFAFRITSTGLLPFISHPDKGIVPPRSKCAATITLQAQEKVPLNNYCSEEFSVQSSRVGRRTPMDVTDDMFDDEMGKVVDEVNLMVVFNMPPIPEEHQKECQEAARAVEPHLSTDKESQGPSSQGFRKVDPDGREFAYEVEVGKFGLEEEMERLKRDKNILMSELVRMRQAQYTTDHRLQTLGTRLLGGESRQQQMMSFLAKAMQSPGFISQFVQHEDNKREIVAVNQKRKLPEKDGGLDSQSVSLDDRVIKDQPMINEAAKTMLRKIIKLDAPHRFESVGNSDNSLLENYMPAAQGFDSSSSTSYSGVAIAEDSANSGLSYIATSSGLSAILSPSTTPEIQGLGVLDNNSSKQLPHMGTVPPVPKPAAPGPNDMTIPELPDPQDMVEVTEDTVNAPGGSFGIPGRKGLILLPEEGDDSVPIETDDILYNDETQK